MARAPFSTAAFAQLVRRLRHTNARYNQIARQFRCRIRPTHHAKRRAYRAGLRIDTAKARACPDKYVSIRPPPVLDRSGGTPAGVDPADAEGAATGAYMRGVPLRHAPRKRRRDGRQRVLLRLPPLKLSLDLDYARAAPFQRPVPGAPRLMPRQLPEEEEGGVEEMVLGSASSVSSYVDAPDVVLTPFDVRVYSGLCITIPPRSLKRKLDDDDADEMTAEQPKRVLKARWNDALKQ